MHKLALLSLNLHCGKEDNYKEKMKLIGLGIDELKPDVILFQECSQLIDDSTAVINKGINIKSSNIGLSIIKNLDNFPTAYDYYYDWGNKAFGNLEEGHMIISKYPIISYESRYVSKTDDIKHWWARKIIRVGVEIDSALVYLYSVHLGWWEDGEEKFTDQLDYLLDWSKEEAEAIHIFAGDFNNSAGTIGYDYMLKKGLRDLYLDVNEKGFYDGTFITSGQLDLEKDNRNKRIDYVMSTSDMCIIKRCYRVFTGEDRPVVSDHCGLFAQVEIEV